MSGCRDCINLQANGICGHYGKEPPPGFAGRCRFYCAGIAQNEPEARSCEQCHRFDRDDTGDWCLVSVDEHYWRFRKLHSEINKICPLI